MLDPTPREVATTVITTRLTVSPDGAVSTATPLLAGDYIASIDVQEAPQRQLPTHEDDADDLPAHDLGPWPEGLSLRREDLYGDDGR